MVRCMSEEKEGKHLRNGLVQVMWIDINQRVKKVGVSDDKYLRRSKSEGLTGHFDWFRMPRFSL